MRSRTVLFVALLARLLAGCVVVPDRHEGEARQRHEELGREHREREEEEEEHEEDEFHDRYEHER